MTNLKEFLQIRLLNLKFGEIWGNWSQNSKWRQSYKYWQEDQVWSGDWEKI